MNPLTRKTLSYSILELNFDVIPPQKGAAAAMKKEFIPMISPIHTIVCPLLY